jgi:hypothetical protein
MKATTKQLYKHGKKIKKLRAELQKLEAEVSWICRNLPEGQGWTAGSFSDQAKAKLRKKT